MHKVSKRHTYLVHDEHFCHETKGRLGNERSLDDGSGHEDADLTITESAHL